MKLFVAASAFLILTLALALAWPRKPPQKGSSKSKEKEAASTSNEIQKQIEQILGQVKSEKHAERLAGIKRARDLLAKSRNVKEMPFDEFISADCLPIFLHCLQDDNNSVEVHIAAAWALANISGGFPEHTRAVLDAGALPTLVKMCHSSYKNALCSHALRAVKNLCVGDGTNSDATRTAVSAGAVPRLIQLLGLTTVEGVRAKIVALLCIIIEKVPEFDFSFFDSESIKSMIENGAVKTFCNFLGKWDAAVNQKVLNGIKDVLKNEEYKSKVIKQLEECHGLDKIAQLRTKESSDVVQMVKKSRPMVKQLKRTLSRKLSLSRSRSMNYWIMQPIINQYPKSVYEILGDVDQKLGLELLRTIVATTDTKLNDIEGNEIAKATLERCVVLPYLNPALFTGLRTPPKGILLFGPPGNGKTMLAKAIANESHSTFFSISASSVLSRWLGESERLVKTLFQMARNAQPSIIFIDEIDSLLCQRSSKEEEVERRVKTEFLVQLDGCSSASMHNHRVLVLGATNRPFDLDESVLRRFPQRIMVDLPDEKARVQMIRKTFEQHGTKLGISEAELEEIAKKTENYSYSDLWNLCTEAAFFPVHNARQNDRLLRQTTADTLRPVNVADFGRAMECIKATSNAENRNVLLQFAKMYSKNE